MMRAKMIVLMVVLVAHAGCESERPTNDGNADPRTLEIVVVESEEHLGHNILETGEHTVWIDGCTARIVESDEPFVIYWVNNAIKDSSWSFETGKTYRLRYSGDLETGVMGYQGKCIDVSQVEQLEEL